MDRFLDSAGGNVAPYDTTANAATTLKGLLLNATVASGEKVWIKEATILSESTSAIVVFTSEGSTPISPLHVICAGDWDESPSTFGNSAELRTTGPYGFQVIGYWRFSGITFAPGAGGGGTSVCAIQVCYGSIGPHYQIFDNCNFIGMSTAYYLFLGYAGGSTGDPSYAVLNNCSFRCTSNNRGIRPQNGRFIFNNMIIDPLETASVSFFICYAFDNVIVEVNNSDFSESNTTALVRPYNSFQGIYTFKNCKLRAGMLAVSSYPDCPGGEVLLINCDSGDGYMRHERHGYEGSWRVAPEIYATTNPADMSVAAGDSFSIQMTATANVSRHLPLYSQWMEVWNDGTAYTPAIEVLVQGDGAAAMTSDQLWLEVDYNSGIDSPLGSRTTTCPDILTAGTTVPAGTTAWTGAGYASERTHKLSIAPITPHKPGFIKMRVALGNPSASIYVNPPR